MPGQVAALGIRRFRMFAGRAAGRRTRQTARAGSQLRAAGPGLPFAERQINRLLEHDLLPLAAEEEAKEFAQRRGERFARGPVDVEVDEPAERIRGERDVFV